MFLLPELDRCRKKQLRKLQKAIGVRFRKLGYLEWALQHRSYVNELRKELNNNEQLEFLGDSVLGLVIAEYLFQKFPKYMEGKLSLLKSSLVNEEVLAQIANQFGLGDYLLLGKGESKGGGRLRASTLADAVEAVIGAYYLDRGFKAAHRFLVKLFKEKVQEVDSSDSLDNAKNRLQKLTQGKFAVLPEYRLIAESGPQHKKTFDVRVWVQGEEVGAGKGKTKKKAEEEAAKEALKKLEQRY